MATDARTATDLKIRWMIRRDHPAVQRIEEWSAQVPLLKSEIVAITRRARTIGYVVEVSDTIGAHAIIRLERDYVQLIRLAVHPEFRGRGIGRRLIATAQRRLSRRRAEMVADVPAWALGAQTWLRHLGWIATEVIGSGTPEEAYRFLWMREWEHERT